MSRDRSYFNGFPVSRTSPINSMTWSINCIFLSRIHALMHATITAWDGHESTNEKVSRFAGKTFFSPEFISKDDPLPMNNKIISYIGGSLLKLHFWMFRIIPEFCHISKVGVDHRSFWELKNCISGSYWSVQLFIFSSLKGESVAGIHCKFC